MHFENNERLDYIYDNFNILSDEELVEVIKKRATNISGAHIALFFRDRNRKLSRKDWIDIVKGNKYGIEAILNPSNELCDLALSNNPAYIRNIHQTSERCFKALSMDGTTLRLIKHHTYEMIVEVIKQNPLAITYANKTMIDDNIRKMVDSHEMARHYLHFLI